MQTTSVQHETFTSPPKFIIVGLKGKNDTDCFYRAKRDIKPVAALNHDHTLKNLSLIIAALFHQKPAMREMKNNKGEPMKSFKTGEIKREPDWESINGMIRYFGFVDLDMDVKKVVLGEEKLIDTDEKPPKEYKNMDLFKADWSKWIKDNSELTIGEIRKVCKPFDEVCTVSEELAECLHKNNKEFLFFYSGCKGFRILYRDPSLFYWCFYHEQYNKAFQDQKAAAYYTSLGMSPLFAKTKLDISVYDNKKGVKPDILAHPDSRLFTFWIKDHTKLNDHKLCSLKPDLELIEKVKQYWVSLADLCPMKIEHLRPYHNQQQPLINETKAISRKRPREILTIPDAENNNNNSNTAMEEDNSCSFGDKHQLSDEFKAGILKWMRAQGRGMNLDRFPNYVYTRKPKPEEPNRFMLKIYDWTYCGRGKRDHSSWNDIWFIITEAGVEQQCFSDKCPRVKFPIYTGKEHADRLAKDKKIANAVIRSHMRREAEELEERKRREYNQRSPSPDSRSSSFVATQYLPKHTETEDDAKFVKEKPTGVVTSQWYYYRHFKQRVDCRDYYKECFRFDSGEYAKVLNLVVQTDLLEAAYLSFDSKKVAELALEEFRGYNLFIVAFNQKLQKSLVWGYCNPNKIKIDREDISKSVILRKYCYQGPTVKGCIELFMSSSTVPQLYNMGLVGKSKTIFHPIAENKEEKEKQGYGFHTHSGKMIFDLQNKEHVQKVLDRIQINVETNIFYLTRGSLAEFVDFFDSFERTLDLCPVIEKEFKEGVDSLQDNNNSNSNEMLLD